jgi:prophage DNA circulation protein
VGARQEAAKSIAGAKAEAEEIVATAKTDADESLDRSEAEAESTAAQSRKEAAERLRRSQEEVAALQEEVEARMRELDADTEVIRRERRALLDEIRGTSARLQEAARRGGGTIPGPGARRVGGEGDVGVHAGKLRASRATSWGRTSLTTAIRAARSGQAANALRQHSSRRRWRGCGSLPRPLRIP